MTSQPKDDQSCRAGRIPASRYRFDPLRATVSWAFPVPCLGCRKFLPSPQPIGLCIRCRGKLKRLRGNRCPGCGRLSPLDCLQPTARCPSCRLPAPEFDRLIAVWSYEPPLDSVVQALKFRRLEYLGELLGRAVAEEIRPALEGVDALVPVPLHWRRRWTRGFNQAERIARGIAEVAQLPVRPWLRRTRATPAQSGLTREERIGNPRGAFRCRDGGAIRSLSLILVDDVATTGATLRAAAAALRDSGAAQIRAVVVGQTPPPPDGGSRYSAS